jgi:hypothetical protein
MIIGCFGVLNKVIEVHMVYSRCFAKKNEFKFGF